MSVSRIEDKELAGLREQIMAIKSLAADLSERVSALEPDQTPELRLVDSADSEIES